MLVHGMARIGGRGKRGQVGGVPAYIGFSETSRCGRDCGHWQVSSPRPVCGSFNNNLGGMITHSILDNAQCASRFPVYPPASAPLESIHGTSSFRPAFFADSSTHLVCNGSRHFTFPGGRVFDWRSTSLVLTPSSAVDQIYRLMAIVVMLGGILPPTCPAVPRTLGLSEALVYIESRTLPHADVIPIFNDIRAQSGVKVQGTVLPPIRVGPSGNAGGS
ncbi:hypothetical protein M433DRAFT_386178 [Acidomyces richmondensis BFW]|nr:MAG: hypothetical protein FE78DRAFT_199989 [Acidomyces sp. 'richmondensis']KYG48776.1 hypothetical protein M433DRAFT_386178 [Acidomyces richmondensis BFW]